MIDFAEAARDLACIVRESERTALRFDRYESMRDRGRCDPRHVLSPHKLDRRERARIAQKQRDALALIEAGGDMGMSGPMLRAAVRRG